MHYTAAHCHLKNETQPAHEAAQSWLYQVYRYRTCAVTGVAASAPAVVIVTPIATRPTAAAAQKEVFILWCE